MENNYNNSRFEGQCNGQTIIIKEKAPMRNSIGTTGFVFAVIAFFTGWIPLLGWVLWALGALFSFFGLFKKPRGLAVAGFILSFIGLIILLAVFGTIGAFGVAASAL